MSPFLRIIGVSFTDDSPRQTGHVVVAWYPRIVGSMPEYVIGRQVCRMNSSTTSSKAAYSAAATSPKAAHRPIDLNRLLRRNGMNQPRLSIQIDRKKI